MIVFGGKKYAMASAKNPVDNSEKLSDNVSEKVFDKYLNDGLKQIVEETVSNEIGEHVDISKMSDPIARDEARDKLPYIHKMLTWYNQLKGKPSYQDHFAARIEYARRCFDNDSRIRNEAVRQINGNEGQNRKYQDSSKTVSRNDIERDNKDSGRITRGVSRHISGEKDGAYKHFLNLYNEEAKKQGLATIAIEDIGHSDDDNQGVFDFAENPDMKYSIGDSSNTGGSNSGIINSFRHPLDTLAKKFHVRTDNDRIITEDQAKARDWEKKKALMDKFINDPTDLETAAKLKEMGVSGKMLKAYQNGEDYKTEFGLRDNTIGSPSRAADKYLAFRAFFNWADAAMKKIVKYRDIWNKKLNEAWANCANDKDREDLHGLLIVGDMEGVDYSELSADEKAAVGENASHKALDEARVKKIVKEHEVTENAARGFVQIRQLITAIGNKIDEALRKPRFRTQHLTDKELGCVGKLILT